MCWKEPFMFRAVSLLTHHVSKQHKNTLSPSGCLSYGRLAWSLLFWLSRWHFTRENQSVRKRLSVSNEWRQTNPSVITRCLAEQVAEKRPVPPRRLNTFLLSIVKYSLEMRSYGKKDRHFLGMPPSFSTLVEDSPSLRMEYYYANELFACEEYISSRTVGKHFGFRLGS